MQQKEILLIKHVEKLGSEGDVVKVRPGYARNYLIPRKKALPLNYANKKRLDSLKLARVARETEELQDAQSMASKLGETSIAVAVKTGTGGTHAAQGDRPGSWRSLSSRVPRAMPGGGPKCHRSCSFPRGLSAQSSESSVVLCSDGLCLRFGLGGSR